jgi:hypothetical protein
MDIGSAYCRRILKSNGRVVHCSTVRPLTADETASPVEQDERKRYDEGINKILGLPISWEELADDPEHHTPIHEPYADEHGDPFLSATEAEDEPTTDTYDQYVGAEVVLPTGDSERTGKVVGRKRDFEGRLVGVASHNPILDSRVYQVEFEDGGVGEYAANLIAQNMYSQCDAEGNQFLLLEAIVDHRKDGHAVDKADMWVQVGSNRHVRKTTKGWHLCVQWKDGSTSWAKLADQGVQPS